MDEIKKEIKSRLEELQKEYTDLEKKRSDIMSYLNQINERMVKITGAFEELSKLYGDDPSIGEEGSIDE